MDEERLKTPSSKTFAEIFKEAFPVYISYGMSCSDFWEGSPFLATAYLKAHKLTLAAENSRLHLQGVYNLKAIIAAFSSKPKIPYPKKPLSLSHEKEPRGEEKQTTQSMKNTRDLLSAWAANYNNQFKNKNKGGEPGGRD